MPQVRVTHRLFRLVAGVAMLLAVGGCATAVPTATSSRVASQAASASPTAAEQRPATWTTTGSMLEARTRHTATLLLDGRVLVAGGFGGSGPVQPSAELYDPTSGAWTMTGNMTMARGGETATLLRNGKVLVVGGMGIGTFSQIMSAGDSAELYDPATGSWSAAGRLSARFFDHTATLLLDGRVLVAGGGSAALYDPEKGIWHDAGKMVKERSHHTATLLPDGRVLVAGGIFGGQRVLASAELYDPATGTWNAVRAMIRGRVFHNAVLLRDGSVLVTSGLAKSHRGQGWEPPEFDELYDPAIGTWTATGLGAGSTDTLLPDGTVLAAGGHFREKSLLASGELYDTNSGVWNATVKMHQARTYQTATLLLDGTVLVAGGYGGADGTSVLASAELYDPGSGA